MIVHIHINRKYTSVKVHSYRNKENLISMSKNAGNRKSYRNTELKANDMHSDKLWAEQVVGVTAYRPTVSVTLSAWTV